MSAIRRSLPALAVSSALAVAAVTAALAPHASAATSSVAGIRAVADVHPLLTVRKPVERTVATQRLKVVAAVLRSTPVTQAAALRRSGVPCDARAAACVSLSRQEAWLMRGGRVVYGPVAVATGRASLPTPTGNFRVFYKVVDGWSNTYDAPMPYSIYFYEGDAFHEDPVDVRSHGCIHLSWASAEYFYRFLHYGDLVEIRE
ncbi:MAG TPA: L,D-transpeptidase [Actinospica sp.]|nr:L,D-transpeptidase [Actinospica sp.]